jgi:hypothetical protein
MNDSDKELADFQVCMLNALHDHDSASAILAALHVSEATLPFRDYISGFEPEMLEVAASLVKKWGVKTSSPNSEGPQEMAH